MSVGISGDFNTSLRDFLVSQYDPESLLRVVSDMPRGDESIRPHLTYPGSLFGMSVEIVDLSLKNGQLDDLKNILVWQRAELRELIEQIWALRIPERPPPALHKHTFPAAVPQPPEYLEERPEHVTIRAALRSWTPLIGITGLPGSGKTTAAIAALDQETRAAFSAVCWLDSLESAAAQTHELRRRIALQLGSPDRKDISREELAGLAASAVGDGHLLVVIDELPGRLDQLADAARCHPRTSLLITSNDSSPLISIGARNPIHLAGLPLDAGLRILARWAGMEVAGLPAAAENLANAIGFHAAGLRLIGATVAAATDTSAEWLYLEKRLRAGAISGQALPGFPDATLSALVDQIVERLSPEGRALIQILAVIPPGSLAGPDVLGMLSGVPADDCRRMGDDLVRRSLAMVSRGKYALPALVHLRSREQRGFDAQYSEAVGRMRPERSPLIWSIANGDTRMALRLVRDSPQAVLNESTPEIGSPLHQAAFHGLDEVVEAILARCAVPFALDRAGADPLHYAAQNGHIQVVRQLMAKGLSPFRPNGGGKDPLFVALYHGHLSTAEVLLEGDAAPHPETDLTTDLQLAIKRGAIRVVQALLKSGAPYDADVGAGNTPALALAVGENHVELAHLLLQAGGMAFRTTTLSEALLFAAQNNHVTLIEPLIRAGANLEWTGTGGRTALHAAAVQGHFEVVRQLLIARSSTSHADAEGWTPVHLAAAFHHAASIDMFHAAGADLDAEGPGGMRPLSLSVLRAGPSATMESSASLGEEGFSFSSVLVLTDIDPRAVQTVRMLLDAGVNVNATDANGRSALHHAAIVLQAALANELLAHGARRDLRDASGKTPLEIARDTARQDAAPLFLLRVEALVSLLER
jgi:ankyrin repeat protein